MFLLNCTEARITFSISILRDTLDTGTERTQGFNLKGGEESIVMEDNEILKWAHPIANEMNTILE